MNALVKFLFCIGLFCASLSASADVAVKGYTRTNGTHVAPHMRSSPNKTTADNFSTRGNINPYTGKVGTKDRVEEHRGAYRKNHRADFRMKHYDYVSASNLYPATEEVSGQQASVDLVNKLWKQYKSIELDDKTTEDRSSPTLNAKLDAFGRLKSALFAHARYEKIQSTRLLVAVNMDFYKSLIHAPCMDFVKQAELQHIEGVDCAGAAKILNKSSYVYLQDAFTFARLGLKLALLIKDEAAIEEFKDLQRLFIEHGVTPSKVID